MKLIPKNQKGKPLYKTYKHGAICDTNECAEFSNSLSRTKYDNLIYGNAWDLKGVNLLYNGYNEKDKPAKYNYEKVSKYNNQASDNFYKNFDSKSLDTDKVYHVNMYYQNSPNQKTAYRDGNNVTGTHTGIVEYNPENKKWMLYHNIHKKVHVEPFTQAQGSGKPWGITAIYEPRSNNWFNSIKTRLGFKNGGLLNYIQNKN